MGFLLEEPKLVAPSHMVAWETGIGNNIPERPRDEYNRAIEEYDSWHYSDAALHCRATLEVALAELGVIPNGLNWMIDDAFQQNVITQEVRNFCRAVAAFGNRSAHPQPDPQKMVGESTAGAAITLTGEILRTLFRSLH